MISFFFLSPPFLYNDAEFVHEESGYAGKDLNDPRVLTDVGDVPVQELRDCGVDDDRLMNIISESVKLVMEEVSSHFQRYLCL